MKQDVTGSAERNVPAVESTSRLRAWVLLIAGIVATIASAGLTIEKIMVLQDPSYVPTCSINPVISCGSVMMSEQASAFGFPNPIIGVAAFPVVAATGAAMLAGARLRGWYWWSLAAGSVFGIGFVHWLMFQSMFRIGALCPYCMVVWACMIVIIVTVASQLARRGRLPSWIATFSPVIIVGWIAIVAFVALMHFRDQWALMFS